MSAKSFDEGLNREMMREEEIRWRGTISFKIGLWYFTGQKDQCMAIKFLGMSVA